ncbi:MAG: ABC transporter ATP-binding protein [Lachnospiraceae bacterium]|nr:ABC transporter ATP-binding protein [Lachnospiraceae bacterium]
MKSGEFLAIMGASGSGKSTLLHILGCIDRPTGGTYFYNGIDVNALSSKEWHRFRKNHISFVFQNFALMNQYTVEENIAIAMDGLLNSPKRRKIREVAELLKIDDVLYKLPMYISGGQQQRTAIARALVSKGELVLCDEPTGALDRRTGEEIMKVIATLRENGKTIIVVTHDPAVASVADRILYMEDGRLLSKDLEQ